MNLMPNIDEHLGINDWFPQPLATVLLPVHCDSFYTMSHGCIAAQ
jgi:hypothetical protein